MIALLIDILRSRAASPVDKVIKNLCNLSCADPTETPLIAETIPAPQGNIFHTALCI